MNQNLCSQCKKSIPKKPTKPTVPKAKKVYLLKDQEKVVKVVGSQKKATDANKDKKFVIETVQLE